MAEGEKAKKVKAPKIGERQRILVSDPAHMQAMYDTLREEWFTFLEIIQEQSKRIGQLEEQLESNQVRSQDWMNAVTGMEDRAKAAEEHAGRTEALLSRVTNGNLEQWERSLLCPSDYHTMSEEELGGGRCRCQPHYAGQAYGCPEGCPTHNPGGEDVPEGAIGGPATDEDDS